MGSVLAFQPRDAATIRKQPVVGVTASIVIFPGVRYERQDEAPRPPEASRRDVSRKKPQPRH